MFTPRLSTNAVAMRRYDEMLRSQEQAAEEQKDRLNRSRQTLSAFCPPLRSKQPDFAPMRPNEHESSKLRESWWIQRSARKAWRRGSESNRRGVFIRRKLLISRFARIARIAELRYTRGTRKHLSNPKKHSERAHILWRWKR